MTLLLLYVALALGVSFLCSVLEAVLLSVTPAYVAAAESDSRVGQLLAELKRNIDRPLAAILSLNTIAHTVGAAGAGAQAAIVFDSVPFGVISGALTLAILVMSEIVPKTLGAVYWKALAPLVARVLVPVIWSMWPLVKLSEGITWLLTRGYSATSVSREELAALAELGGAEGVLEEDESRIVGNVFRFRSLRTRAIMTPRTVMFTRPATATVADVMRDIDAVRFSRIPLGGVDRDRISSYVLKSDVLLAAARGEQETPLAALEREMLIVPESLPLPSLLGRLLDKREHIALVVDEFGGTSGVVTMEDVIETLLGLEIVDEADSVEDMQELARRNWLSRARRLGILDVDALDALGEPRGGDP